jgi:hypothetical protein
MDDKVYKSLKEHRTAASWLNDIIDVLLRFRGTAHVSTIARELANSYGRDIEAMEQTITRRINDFCSDATDWKKTKDYDLFKRVEPATYKLRSYPDRPDINELGLGGGRDPLRSVAKTVLERTTHIEGHPNFGKRLPTDKEKLKKLLDNFITKHMDEINVEVAKRRAAKTSKEEFTLEDLGV